ncbi:MAG: hypothetical protein UIG52_09100 [Bacteroidales bacterium]|jgi:hypothetical protein|nr:hypothetical protein [Bacteroidales bacterium]
MKLKNKVYLIENFINFWRYEWANIIMSVLTIALTIALAILPEWYKNLNNCIKWSIISCIFVGYLILYICNYNIQNKKQKTIKNLEEELDKTKKELDKTKKELDEVKKAYNDVFEFELIKIYQKLDFDNCERISIYKVEGNNCKVVSRHSYRPEFRKYDKDKIYPLSNGFIGKAWESENGDFFIKNLPNYEKNAGKYINQCIKLCNIDENTIKQLSMKSRSYYCKVLRNSDETDNIAIIVFESLSTKNINKEHIDSILKEENKSLATFIQKIVFEVIKSNTDLSKEGF